MRNIEPPDECYIQNKYNGAIVGLSVLGILGWILEEHPIRTILETGKMTHYARGVYKPYADEVIDEMLEACFGKLVSGTGKLLLRPSLVNTIKEKIKHSTYIKTETFDNNSDIINMMNGLYNWRTGEFMAHDPGYPCIVQIPVKYNPSAKCPKIEKSFKAVFYDEDLEKWLEFIAYCLYNGYPIQKAFILYSSGENGKSFVMNILRGLLGVGNCAEVALQEFASDRFASSDLYGKMLNSCGDLDDKTLKRTGEFKKLISGYDPVRAQEKKEKAFTFVNRAKMIFGTNIIPKVNDTSIGFFRRIEPIQTDKLQPGDKDRLGLPNDKEVLTEEEMSGLFNWVIPKLGRLLERGKFTNQKTLDEVTTLYKNASDPIMEFIETHLVESGSCNISKEAVYQSFEKFIIKLPGSRTYSTTKFWMEMHKLLPGVRYDKAYNRITKKMEPTMFGYTLKSADEYSSI